MDHGRTTDGKAPLRFPRPRGDGPQERSPGNPPGEVSPPTRGWTLERVGGYLLRGGFPAHAGMDPHELMLELASTGFPRPRGDGPGRRPHAVPACRVSPPTRGWTLSALANAGAVTGFPAHAGMDPPNGRSCMAYARFPRPRGDGPVNTGTTYSLGLVSPPTRGWTLDEGLLARTDYGFPAHAGMDPSVGGGDRRGLRFPRPRGDGPA